MTEFRTHIRDHRLGYTILGVVLLFITVGFIIREVTTTLGEDSALILEEATAGSSISIDGRTVETVEEQEMLVVPVSSGEHTVAIERHNHHPWQKTLSFTAHATTTIAPFNLSRTPEILPISAGVEDDAPRGASLFAVAKHRPQTNPLLSEDENLAIWQDESGIHATWHDATSTRPSYFCFTETCSNEFLVTELQEPVSTIDFFPGRTDIILVTTNEGIFALELDRRPIQNFQPLLAQPGADVRLRDNESVYIRYNNALYILPVSA